MVPAGGDARPRSSGADGRDSGGLRKTAASAGQWVELATERLAIHNTNPAIVVDGTGDVLLPTGSGWGPSRFELGSLAIERRGRRTELVPGAPVPVEGAVLAWLVIAGDVIFPEAAGGGG